MVFTVELEGQSISCSSARCIQRLLRQGWALADPAQGDELVRAVETEAPAEPSATVHALDRGRSG
jgi:hypothetical protein